MKFLYAHGFTSGPSSRKARVFERAFAGRSTHLEIPALDGGDFEHLTVSGQLSLIESALGAVPARLIGSSMGGYLAALYANRHPEAERLVLLAPAFGFAPRWVDKFTPGIGIDVFHYGTLTTRRVHYGLIEDALKFPATPAFHQPALIFHGIHDDVVPIEHSRQFAADHPNVRLIELDSDHELLNSLDAIVGEAVPFLLNG